MAIFPMLRKGLLWGLMLDEAKQSDLPPPDDAVDIAPEEGLGAEPQHDLAHVGRGLVARPGPPVDEQLPADEAGLFVEAFGHQLAPSPRSAPTNRRPRVSAAYPNEPDPANG